jgi:hypothetical protein
VQGTLHALPGSMARPDFPAHTGVWVTIMWQWLLAGGGVLLGLAVMALVVLTFSQQANGGAGSVDQRSSDLPDDPSKIAFLKKYLQMNSEIEWAEFHLLFKDNAGLVPAPSDLDLKVVMRMDPQDVLLWTAGLEPSDEKIDFAWGHALLQERGWEVHASPLVFVRGRTVVAAFKTDGVVFKRVIHY